MFHPMFSRHVLRLAMSMRIPSVEALRFISAGPAKKGEGRVRRSKYTPGGPNRNCGWNGISPKSVRCQEQREHDARFA